MVTLEQIKLLETKVAKAIDIVTRITGENAYLKGKLETYQKRIDELEVLIQRFKEDQGRIEDGILSALDRLNQFEATIENSIAPIKPEAASAPQREPVNEATVPEEEEPGETLIFSVSEDDDPEEDEGSEGDAEDEAPEDDDAKSQDDSGGGTAELDIF
jgi:chromosome segregation ATPase